MFLGKLLRCDYSLQYEGVLEIPELALEGLACKHSTIYAEMTTGISEVVQLSQGGTAQGGDLGAARAHIQLCTFWFSVTSVISGLW